MPASSDSAPTTASTPAGPTDADVRRALDRLRILGLTQAIRDPQLNYALTPFRGRPPTALICANATCTAPFAWCGLDATTARVHFSRSQPIDAGWDPAAEATAAEPVAMPGEPLLRWRFRCARCQRPSLLSNSRLLTLILRAASRGEAQITPAAE